MTLRLEVDPGLMVAFHPLAEIGVEKIGKLLEFGGTWRTVGEIFRSVAVGGVAGAARGAGDYFYFSWVSEADAYAWGFAEVVCGAWDAGVFRAGGGGD